MTTIPPITAAARHAAQAATRSGIGSGPLVIVGVLGAGMLCVSAMIAYKVISGLTVGAPIDDARDAMARMLDHDQSRTIDYAAPTLPQEFIRVEEINDDDDMFTDHYELWDESAKLVAADADANRSVTREELRDFLAIWDDNGNGKLSLREALHMEQAHPKVLVDRSYSSPSFDRPFVPRTPPPPPPQ